MWFWDVIGTLLFGFDKWYSVSILLWEATPFCSSFSYCNGRESRTIHGCLWVGSVVTKFPSRFCPLPPYVQSQTKPKLNWAIGTIQRYCVQLSYEWRLSVSAWPPRSQAARPRGRLLARKGSSPFISSLCAHNTRTSRRRSETVCIIHKAFIKRHGIISSCFVWAFPLSNSET